MHTGLSRDTGFVPLIARALASAVPVGLVAYAGSRATLPSIPGWYAGLAKPPFTPPNAVFGPAWTILYILMAIAIFRILAAPPSPARRRAVTAFAVQLVLNGLWSIAFFAAQSPTLGLVVIAAMLVAIVWTILAFHRIDRPAALMLLPYLAWVTFASYLNGGVWLLNPSS